MSGIRLMLAICGIAAALSAVALAAAISQRTKSTQQTQQLLNEVHDTSVTNCKQIELLKGYVRELAARSEKTLPTTAYYKEHPDELERAQIENEQIIALFHATPCN